MKRSPVVPILLLSLLAASGSWTACPAADGQASHGGADPFVITLQAGLQEVAANGHDVQITREGENIASADVRLARSGFLPSLNGSASHTTLEYQIASVVSAPALVPVVTPSGLTVQRIIATQVVPEVPINYYAYSATVQQTLFDFWRTVSRYRESKQVFDNSKLETNRVRNQSALEFAGAYFDLLETDKFVTVAQQELDQLNAHLKDAQNLYGSGAITKNDLLQAEVRVKDGAQKLLSTQNRRALAASAVNNLLVRPVEQPIRVVDIEYKPGPAPYALNDAWEEALKERPEMKIVEGSLKALHLEEVARRADYFPTFFVRGGVDYQQNQYLVHDANWSATVGVSVNFFAGGATDAAIARTKAQQYQVLKQRAKLVDGIKLEVQRYSLDLDNARERIQVARGAADQARENLRINKVRYDAGEGIATEVLDAVTLLTVTENNYIRAVYDYRRAEAGIYYAVGKDLREAYKQ